MRALPVDRTLRPGSSMTTEMNVDFPVPLRPTRPTFSPAPTTNEASRSRVRSPISMVREDPTIMGRGRGWALRSGVSRRGAGRIRRTDPVSLPQTRARPVGAVWLPVAQAAGGSPYPGPAMGHHGPEGELVDRPQQPPVGHADDALGAQRPDLLDPARFAGRDPEPEPRLTAEPVVGAEHQGFGLTHHDRPPVDLGPGAHLGGATEPQVLTEPVSYTHLR